jgi:hypothetical protein
MQLTPFATVFAVFVIVFCNPAVLTLTVPPVTLLTVLAVEATALLTAPAALKTALFILLLRLLVVVANGIPKACLLSLNLNLPVFRGTFILF